MKSPPSGLDAGALRAAVAHHWALDIATFAFDPVGAGSYHWRLATTHGQRYFVTVDDLDAKPAWGTDRAETFAAMCEVFDMACALHADGLDFVVAPLHSTSGQLVERLNARFSLVVHPFVDGRTGSFDDVTTSGDRKRLLAALAELHQEPEPSSFRLARVFPERRLLEAALADLDHPWDAGPYARRAHDWLAEHRDRVQQLVADLDFAASPRASDLVVTHGEPHPGNLVWTRHGLRLVDWDTVALAPPERDLWHVRCEHPDELAEYERATGHPVDHVAMRSYAAAWRLSDIALYLDDLRRPHDDDADSAFAWQVLQRQWER